MLVEGAQELYVQPMVHENNLWHKWVCTALSAEPYSFRILVPNKLGGRNNLSGTNGAKLCVPAVKNCRR